MSDNLSARVFGPAGFFPMKQRQGKLLIGMGMGLLGGSVAMGTEESPLDFLPQGVNPQDWEILEEGVLWSYLEPFSIVHEDWTVPEPQVVEGAMHYRPDLVYSEESFAGWQPGWRSANGETSLLAALRFNTRGEGVRVAHIEKWHPFWRTHPLLGNLYGEFPDEIMGNGIDDDGNGWVDDRYGLFTYVPEAEREGQWYNSHALGTARVMALVAPGMDLFGITSRRTWGSYYDQFRLANYSMGGVDWHASRAWGTLFIAAAGNDRVDLDDYPNWEENHSDQPNVIYVGNTRFDKRYNYGEESVDIQYSDGYIERGTSGMAPMVTSVVAMGMSIDPSLSNEQIKALLLETAQVMPHGEATPRMNPNAFLTRIYTGRYPQARVWDFADFISEDGWQWDEFYGWFKGFADSNWIYHEQDGWVYIVEEPDTWRDIRFTKGDLYKSSSGSNWWRTDNGGWLVRRKPMVIWDGEELIEVDFERDHVAAYPPIGEAPQISVDADSMPQQDIPFAHTIAHSLHQGFPQGGDSGIVLYWHGDGSAQSHVVYRSETGRFADAQQVGQSNSQRLLGHEIDHHTHYDLEGGYHLPHWGPRDQTLNPDKSGVYTVVAGAEYFTFVDESAQEGTPYTYWVRSESAEGVSPLSLSLQASYTTGKLTAEDGQAPVLWLNENLSRENSWLFRYEPPTIRGMAFLEHFDEERIYPISIEDYPGATAEELVGWVRSGDRVIKRMEDGTLATVYPGAYFTLNGEKLEESAEVEWVWENGAATNRVRVKLSTDPLTDRELVGKSMEVALCVDTDVRVEITHNLGKAIVEDRFDELILHESQRERATAKLFRIGPDAYPEIWRHNFGEPPQQERYALLLPGGGLVDMGEDLPLGAARYDKDAGKWHTIEVFLNGELAGTITAVEDYGYRYKGNGWPEDVYSSFNEETQTYKYEPRYAASYVYSRDIAILPWEWESFASMGAVEAGYIRTSDPFALHFFLSPHIREHPTTWAPDYRTDQRGNAVTLFLDDLSLLRRGGTNTFEYRYYYPEGDLIGGEDNMLSTGEIELKSVGTPICRLTGDEWILNERDWEKYATVREAAGWENINPDAPLLPEPQSDERLEWIPGGFQGEIPNSVGYAELMVRSAAINACEMNLVELLRQSPELWEADEDFWEGRGPAWEGLLYGYYRQHVSGDYTAVMRQWPDFWERDEAFWETVTPLLDWPDLWNRAEREGWLAEFARKIMEKSEGRNTILNLWKGVVDGSYFGEHTYLGMNGQGQEWIWHHDTEKYYLMVRDSPTNALIYDIAEETWLWTRHDLFPFVWQYGEDGGQWSRFE